MVGRGATTQVLLLFLQLLASFAKVQLIVVAHVDRVLWVLEFISLFCLLTISLIQIGANGEVQPFDTG